MDGTGERVEPLKKIKLTVTAGNGFRTAAMEFVYGVGPEGLTPFEYALADAAVGDTITVQLEKGRYGHTFGHIQMILPGSISNDPPLSLRVRVDNVEPARQREIIRAMAEASTCNDTCCGH